MILDLSKLSPAFREKVAREVRIMADEQRIRMKLDLDGWPNKSSSPARDEMEAWMAACSELSDQALRCIRG